LSEKPWKFEAVIRLLAAVFLCMCAGSLLVSAIYHPQWTPRTKWTFALAAGTGGVFLFATLFQLRQSLSRENLSRRLLPLLICFYAGLILTAWAETLVGPDKTVPSTGQMLIGMLSFQGATLLLIGVFLYQQHMGWVDGFGLRNEWPKAILWGIITAGLFLPIGLTLQHICENLLRSHFPAQSLEQLPVQTLRMAHSWPHRIVLSVATIILAPLAEEGLFRGILYPVIRQAGFPNLALWITSLAFAALHMNFVAFLPLFLLSVLLTIAYERTNNLITSITAHMMFNGFGLTVLFWTEYFQKGT